MMHPAFYSPAQSAACQPAALGIVSVVLFHAQQQFLPLRVCQLFLIHTNHQNLSVSQCRDAPCTPVPIPVPRRKPDCTERPDHSRHPSDNYHSSLLTSHFSLLTHHFSLITSIKRSAENVRNASRSTSQYVNVAHGQTTSSTVLTYS